MRQSTLCFMVLTCGVGPSNCMLASETSSQLRLVERSPGAAGISGVNADEAVHIGELVRNVVRTSTKHPLAGERSQIYRIYRMSRRLVICLPVGSLFGYWRSEASCICRAVPSRLLGTFLQRPGLRSRRRLKESDNRKLPSSQPRF